MRVLYHDCGWVFGEDAALSATVNECGGCGRRGLSFIHSSSPQILRKALRDRKLPIPQWLEDAVAVEATDNINARWHGPQVP